MKKHKKMGNYYKRDIIGTETITWAFEDSESRRIRENDTQYIPEKNTDKESDVQELADVQEITAQDFAEYCNNINDWVQFVPGSRPPHKPSA